MSKPGTNSSPQTTVTSSLSLSELKALERLRASQAKRLERWSKLTPQELIAELREDYDRMVADGAINPNRRPFDPDHLC